MKKTNESNLEEKILKKVYTFEKQRTSLVVARYLVLFFGVAALIVLATIRIFAILGRQGDLDLFQLFGEDRTIITQYFGEVADTFVIEFPKFLGLILGILMIVFAVVIFVIKNNYKKIKNKINSLKK